MHRHQVTELVYHLRPHMTVQGWILLHRYQAVHHQQHHTSKLREQVHVILLVETHPFTPLASQAVAWRRQLLQAQDKELAILRLQHQALYNQIHTSLRLHLQAMGHQAEAG
jgi:hypothetical protein